MIESSVKPQNQVTVTSSYHCDIYYIFVALAKKCSHIFKEVNVLPMIQKRKKKNPTKLGYSILMVSHTGITKENFKKLNRIMCLIV